MQEVLKYLRANGYKTYIVTGGGQDFVRVYAEATYGIPPEQVVGTAGGTKYGYDKDGKPFLTKEPKLLLNDNNAGKPEGIHLMIGRRPSRGVRQLDRRPADARVHEGRRRRAAVDARAARRRRSASTPTVRRRAARHQGRRLHPGALRRGEEAGLDRHQHEERLEEDLRVRMIGCERQRQVPCSGADGRSDHCGGIGVSNDASSARSVVRSTRRPLMPGARLPSSCPRRRVSRRQTLRPGPGRRRADRQFDGDAMGGEPRRAEEAGAGAHRRRRSLRGDGAGSATAERSLYLVAKGGRPTRTRRAATTPPSRS